MTWELDPRLHPPALKEPEGNSSPGTALGVPRARLSPKEQGQTTKR